MLPVLLYVSYVNPPAYCRWIQRLIIVAAAVLVNGNHCVVHVLLVVPFFVRVDRQVTKADHIIASDVYKPSLDRLATSGIRTSQANMEVI